MFICGKHLMEVQCKDEIRAFGEKAAIARSKSP